MDYYSGLKYFTVENVCIHLYANFLVKFIEINSTDFSTLDLTLNHYLHLNLLKALSFVVPAVPVVENGEF